jgi:hypothetical protein
MAGAAGLLEGGGWAACGVRSRSTSRPRIPNPFQQPPAFPERSRWTVHVVMDSASMAAQRSDHKTVQGWSGDMTWSAKLGRLLVPSYRSGLVGGL